jgi:hypothetical protein
MTESNFLVEKRKIDKKLTGGSRRVASRASVCPDLVLGVVCNGGWHWPLVVLVLVRWWKLTKWSLAEKKEER